MKHTEGNDEVDTSIIEEYKAAGNELEEDTERGKYMTFKSGNEYFGLELQCVNEIIGIQPITEVPEVEDYLRGLINLRGKIIPVIDVRLRFKQEPFEYIWLREVHRISHELHSRKL